MRPRLIASENISAGAFRLETRACFNEAEADRLGKRRAGRSPGRSRAGFNEAEADRLGKPMAHEAQAIADRMLQ